MERREFMAGSAGGALAAAALAGLPGAAAADGGVPTEAQFRSQVGKVFYVYPGLRGIALELIAVHDVHMKTVAGHSQFTLVFQGRAADDLPAGTYPADNAVLGRFELALQPAGHRGSTHIYRAEFSLLG